MIEDRYVTLQLQIEKVERIKGARSIAKLCQDWGLGKQPQEAMWVIAYDVRGGVRNVVEVARGGYNDMHVDIASVMTAVVGTASTAFTVAHNHPAGLLLPSELDVGLTHDVMAAANACGLVFEEHIIVGPSDEYFSFVDAGLINPAPRGGNVAADIKAAQRRSGK